MSVEKKMWNAIESDNTSESSFQLASSIYTFDTTIRSLRFTNPSFLFGISTLSTNLFCFTNFNFIIFFHFSMVFFFFFVSYYFAFYSNNCTKKMIYQENLETNYCTHFTTFFMEVIIYSIMRNNLVYILYIICIFLKKPKITF